MHRSRFTFSLTARLDRFGRVVDQRWCTIAGGTDVELWRCRRRTAD